MMDESEEKEKGDWEQKMAAEESAAVDAEAQNDRNIEEQRKITLSTYTTKELLEEIYRRAEYLRVKNSIEETVKIMFGKAGSYDTDEKVKT